tara:strand:- start:110 stop:307 length:198 start_codon:yes stop_codon:yes gene_type:complete
LYGLYDTDGILRFLCSDREACIAYAKLFDIPSVEDFLMAMPEPANKAKSRRTKRFTTHRQAMNNN